MDKITPIEIGVVTISCPVGLDSCSRSKRVLTFQIILSWMNQYLTHLSEESYSTHWFSNKIEIIEHIGRREHSDSPSYLFSLNRTNLSQMTQGLMAPMRLQKMRIHNQWLKKLLRRNNNRRLKKPKTTEKMQRPSSSHLQSELNVAAVANNSLQNSGWFL